MDTKSETKKVGAVLVLGGEIGGIQASLDLAEAPLIGPNSARKDKQ